MRKLKLRGHIIRFMCYISLIVLVLLTGGVFREADVKADEQVIRVGYVQAENFIKENNGQYSGYCVDYLEAIATYTGWTYEYIEGSWEECLQNVENGKVDIVCMVQYTEERATRFIFSDASIGTEYGLIYAKEGADIYYGDYANMNGMSIAMLPGTVFDDRLDELESIENITFKRVYYATIEEIMNALEAGDTDLAMIGSIFGNTSAKVVGRDDGMPIYCVTGKQNSAFMEQFSEGMRLAKLNEPGLESRLFQKYYSDDKISSSPLFTREEMEYVEGLGSVVVRLMTRARPLCYSSDGELAGIFVEYMKLLSEKTGLEIRVEETTSTEFNDLTNGIVSGNYLTLRSKRVIENFGLDEELISSNPIFETDLTYVKRKDETYGSEKTDYVFAISREMDYYLPGLLRRDNPDCDIRYYDTADECLDAVLDGEADIAISDEYVISYLMQKPEYNDKLVQTSGSALVNGMCLIGSQDDRVLFEIFNKAIAYIPESELENIVTVELKSNSYDWNLGDFIYRYWVWIVVVVLIVAVVAVVYTVLLRRMIRLQIHKQDFESLQKAVRQDDLTGVYNKRYFYEEAERMIKETREDMYIVLMDIINFKVVNDLFGLNKGDSLLKHIAKDLQRIAEGRNILIARFSADHFYMCMTARDFNELELPRKYKNIFPGDMDIRVCYGVFMIKEQRDIPVNIMCDRASIAIHNVQNKGDSYIFFYTEDERKRMVRQQEIENDMEKALERKEFCVYIQPKYDIYKGKIVGGEALARWIHPEKGMISPGDFIPVFEKNGFIRYLDYYIWEETCRLIAEIKEKGLGSYPVSINVSRAHFYTNELVGRLKGLLSTYKLQPEELEIEITESIYVEDSDIINERIQELRDLGFKIAMDDFGSGYSSLNMLKEIPLDIIKMDLKFLDSSENVEKSHKILDSLVDLAKRLDLYVVVEGVETEEQVEFLQGIGEMSAQGFYFSRPINAAMYEELLVRDKVS